MSGCTALGATPALFAGVQCGRLKLHRLQARGPRKETMHEMSIAAAVAEQVLAVAKENNLAKVTQVRLQVGELRLIVPEALCAAWEAVREGTAAAGARLEITEVPAKARCRKCGHEYHPEWPVFLCPACEQASVEVLAGEELVLEEISGEAEEAGSG